MTQGFFFLFTIYPLTIFGLPLADPTLSRIDAILGFHWGDTAQFVSHHPKLLSLLRACYGAFDWEGFAIITVLVVFGFEGRAWRVVLSAIWALAISSVIFAFLPAEGAFMHSSLRTTDVPGLASDIWRFGPIHHQIRDHGVRYIGAQTLSGIISFPSYHAACALIFAWALWPVKWLRWPAVALNTGMALAAIPIGAHYFIDVLAGLVVGQLALTVAAHFLPEEGRGAKGVSLEEEVVEHLRREDRHRT